MPEGAGRSCRQRSSRVLQQLPLCSVLLCLLLAASAAASLLDIGRGSVSRAEGLSSVVRCSFVAGGEGGLSSSSLSSFLIPARDRAMYEEGLKDYLQQIGAQPAELTVVCTPHLSREPITCQLCLYNEVSADLKHARQGQVLSAALPQCMQGDFSQASKMQNSQYHPICYPEEKQAAIAQDSSSSSSNPQQQQIAPHGVDDACSN